ncbi:MAG: 30S ribosomal protein S16 [bacterium]
MLTIRLYRTGKKGQPFFKIVVTDKRSAAHRGRFVEEVGVFNPIKKDKAFKAERIKYWLKMGAKPSATVYNLLVTEKILEGKKIAKHAKSKKKEEAKPVSVAPKEAPAVKMAPEVKVEPAKEAPVAEVTPEESK